MEATLISEEGAKFDLKQDELYVIGNKAFSLKEVDPIFESFSMKYKPKSKADLDPRTKRVDVYSMFVFIDHAQVRYLGDRSAWSLTPLHESFIFPLGVLRDGRYQRVSHTHNFYLQNDDKIVLGDVMQTGENGYHIVFKESQGSSPKQRLLPRMDVNKPEKSYANRSETRGSAGSEDDKILVTA